MTNGASVSVLPPHPNPADDLTRRTSHLVLGLLLLLLFLALTPYVANYVAHHPDERHYTNAAITMIDTGDYLTPRTAEGTYRFHKPILTYWCVAASYQLLGVSPWASRLPFLVAGALIVWLTYRLALLMCGSRMVAICAASITMCHPMLVASSTRSMPDVLFSFFLLLSIYGFLQLLAGQTARPSAYWASYVGCALAIATKGLPAVVFLGFSWVFALGNPWQRVKWRRLIHMPSMLVAAVIACSWFAIMYAMHGNLVFDRFWDDQVSRRVTEDLWSPVYTLPLFVAACVLSFVPWILPLLVRPRQAWNTIAGRPEQLYAVRYILVWVFAYAILAAMVSKFSTRYLLPVIPLLAVLLAMALTRLESHVFRRWLQLGLCLTCLTLLLLGTVAMVVAIQLDAGLSAMLVTLAIVAGSLVITAGGVRGTRLTAAVCLTALLYLTYPLAFLTLRHFVVPDQGAQLAKRLDEMDVSDGQPIRIVGKRSLASKLRVCSGGRAQVSRYDLWMWTESDRPPVVILSDCDLARVDTKGYEIHVGSQGLKDMAIDEVIVALLRGKLADYVQRRRQSHVIAVRAEGPPTARFADQNKAIVR